MPNRDPYPNSRQEGGGEGVAGESESAPEEQALRKQALAKQRAAYLKLMARS